MVSDAYTPHRSSRMHRSCRDDQFSHLVGGKSGNVSPGLLNPVRASPQPVDPPAARCCVPARCWLAGSRRVTACAVVPALRVWHLSPSLRLSLRSAEPERAIQRTAQRISHRPAESDWRSPRLVRFWQVPSSQTSPIRAHHQTAHPLPPHWRACRTRETDPCQSPRLGRPASPAVLASRRHPECFCNRWSPPRLEIA